MENGRRPCFYEIFSSNLTSQRLRFPAGFVKHMEGRMCGSVSLFGPSGNVWRAELVRQNDDVLLGHGWSEFIRDHFVESGDLLVFRYDGELCFTVQVFDQSACEKEAAFHSVCGQGLNISGSVGGKRERGEKGGESVNGGFESAPKRVRGDSSWSPSASEDKYWEDGIGLSDKGGCLQDEEISNRTRLDVCLSNETRQCQSPPGNSALLSQLKEWNERADLKTEAAIKRRIGKDNDSTLQDRGCGSIFSEREKRVAQSFISCFPYFVRIMKKFNISGSYTLNIPYQFATAHLPNCKTEIVLRTVKGASWTVNSVPTTRVHTSHTLCGGWMAFVRSNDIKIGDVCIFELVRKFELRVFILRVGKEGPDDQTRKVDSTGVNVGSNHKVESLLKKSQKNAWKVHSRYTKKVDFCDKKGFKKAQPTSLSNYTRKHGDATNGAAPNGERVEMVGLKAESGLRTMVSRKEDKAGESFSSGFPNFVRIMRKFNISGSYTLKIPHQFSAAYLPNFKTEIVLRNLEGDSWTVNSVPDSKGRTVHTFCGGWMAFVRDNDIQIGDICMFELINDHEMQVHISGVGRKALDYQCGNEASQDLSLVEFSGVHPPS